VSENLELVRSIYADWERGDYSSANWASPEIELVIADGPVVGTWTGLAGLAEATREVLGTLEGARIEAESFRDLGGERVLVLSRFTGRGKSSGVEMAEVRARGASVFDIQDGMVTRHTFCFDRARALADLGLEE
jgi:hypothetical protein